MNVASNIFAEVIVLIIVVVLVAIAAVVFRRHAPSLNKEYFQKKWKSVQDLCKEESTWPLAIINADKLLDEALKKHRLRGETMGERLVRAQKMLSDNDAAWHAHKLRNRLVHDANVKLRKPDVMKSLSGIRKALKDLGAL
jgi:hypothetical protein